jgi:hypothetical protein
MNVFELVTASNIKTYWENMAAQRGPFLGEVLFPSQKKLGLDLKWISGNSGIPVVLNLSGFDAPAIPRGRGGFTVTNGNMPFFKESTYIDEEMRQQLNIVLSSGVQGYIDAVVKNIFDDSKRLIEAARVQRERMRMSMLTTGAIVLASNGQNVNVDYGVPNDHKKTVTKAWSDPTADIMGELRDWMQVIETDTGVRPTRALCSRKTWNYLLANTAIRNTLFVFSGGVSVISDKTLRSFLFDQLELAVSVSSQMFMNELGVSTKYVPDDTFVMFPPGQLGSTWFGTTPEESDLLGRGAANVAIIDTGVAITTMQKTDPVNVETKISMISLPSFEASGQIIIADLIP